MQLQQAISIKKKHTHRKALSFATAADKAGSTWTTPAPARTPQKHQLQLGPQAVSHSRGFRHL